MGGGPIVPMRILERGMVLLDISADASKALGLKARGGYDGPRHTVDNSDAGRNPAKTE